MRYLIILIAVALALALVACEDDFAVAPHSAPAQATERARSAHPRNRVPADCVAGWDGHYYRQYAGLWERCD